MEFPSLRFADVIDASTVGGVDRSTAGGPAQALLPLLEPCADAALAARLPTR
jgi:hypothetical protein